MRGAEGRPSDRRVRPPIVALGAALLLATSGGLAAQEERAEGPGTAERLESARLVGQVVSAVTGEGLAGAALSLQRSRRGAVTDSAGRFSIPEAIAGEDTLEVRYVGYETGSTSIYLEPDATTRVVLLLSPNVVEVADLEVEIERGEFRLGLREFERRKAKGIGHFVTREQIERQEARQTSDVLRRVPGLRVGPSHAGGRTEVTLGRGALPCRPVIFVDGLHLAGASVDDVTVPDLGGIEVYTGAGQIPAQYASMAPSACGAILIWTRRGRRPGDEP